MRLGLACLTAKTLNEAGKHAPDLVSRAHNRFDVFGSQVREAHRNQKMCLELERGTPSHREMVQIASVLPAVSFRDVRGDREPPPVESVP
jgi:hypothetical protein